MCVQKEDYLSNSSHAAQPLALDLLSHVTKYVTWLCDLWYRLCVFPILSCMWRKSPTSRNTDRIQAKSSTLKRSICFQLDAVGSCACIFGGCKHTDIMHELYRLDRKRLTWTYFRRFHTGTWFLRAVPRQGSIFQKLNWRMKKKLFLL